jgi:hypothetical protein
MARKIPATKNLRPDKDFFTAIPTVLEPTKIHINPHPSVLKNRRIICSTWKNSQKKLAI